MIGIDFKDIVSHLIVSDAIVPAEYIRRGNRNYRTIGNDFFQMRQFLIKDNNGYVLCFGEEA